MEGKKERKRIGERKNKERKGNKKKKKINLRYNELALTHY